MADVINLADHRQRPRPPVEQVLAECVDALMEDWGRAAHANKLNDFIVASASPHARAGTSYLANLQAISDLEGRVGMTVTVWAPGSREGQAGWIAGFVVEGRQSETPPMVTEQYARCFNVLLCMKLRRDMARA